MVFGNCSGLERETKRKTLEREGKRHRNHSSVYTLWLRSSYRLTCANEYYSVISGRYRSSGIQTHNQKSSVSRHN